MSLLTNSHVSWTNHHTMHPYTHQPPSQSRFHPWKELASKATTYIVLSVRHNFALLLHVHSIKSPGPINRWKMNGAAKQKLEHWAARQLAVESTQSIFFTRNWEREAFAVAEPTIVASTHIFLDGSTLMRLCHYSSNTTTASQSRSRWGVNADHRFSYILLRKTTCRQ